MMKEINQSSSNMLAHQGHRLIQIGVALLLFLSFEGFVIPVLASPALGLSAHRLSSILSVLLIGLGLVWTRLNLGVTASRIAFWLLIYSALAIDAAYVLAAIWGAGNETITQAAGTARGTALQETVIAIIAYSSAPTGIISFLLILWGLRLKATKSSG